MKKTLQSLGVAALAALFLVGCGAGDQEQAPAPAESQTDAQTLEETADQNTSQQENVDLTLDDAKEIALKNAGLPADQVVFGDSDLEEENGRMIYEIDFETPEKEYEYEIDANTGEILKTEVDNKI